MVFESPYQNATVSELKFITRSRVRKDYRTATWRGREGTIEKSWGDPTYSALDVLLDDGISQLFWHHELEEADSGVA